MTIASWLSLLLASASLGVILLILKKLTTTEDATGHTEKTLREEFRLTREEAAHSARELREEVAAVQKNTNETVLRIIGEMGKAQQERLIEVENRIKSMTEANRADLEKIRATLAGQLKDLQEGNEKKLDQMRQTVDEKLQTTLEKRLGESFKQVSERLESVQRGLGEMHHLAAGVGDLKRMLTNVKTRGTWGEVQLGAILEQILTPEQYERNVKTREHSPDMVEYAIKLPGTGRDADSVVWLPIDAKFPQEDYQRLLAAAEAADNEAVEKSSASLARALLLAAKEISGKYLNPPHTTDFAIMFLPTEGLYAELLRQPGLSEKLLHDFRVVAAGPTTLAATLSSLRMGFRTLAIERRSSEVWEILSAVKTEFGRFGEVLGKVKKQLATAANTIDDTEVRTRVMERKLKSVEELPTARAECLLGLDEPAAEKTGATDEKI